MSKQIQMVDLKSQYENIKDSIDPAILDTVRSTQFVNGPQVKSFQDYIIKETQNFFN